MQCDHFIELSLMVLDRFFVESRMAHAQFCRTGAFAELMKHPGIFLEPFTQKVSPMFVLFQSSGSRITILPCFQLCNIGLPAEGKHCVSVARETAHIEIGRAYKAKLIGAPCFGKT